MRRLKFVAGWSAVALATTGILGLGTGISSAAAATSWSSTLTRAEALVGATAVGPEPASTPLRIAVALKIVNRAGLDQTIANGQVLTPAQFTATHSPSIAQASLVQSYLSSHGFTGVAVASNRLLVTATGTVGAATAAFNTPIERFTQHGKAVFANTKAAQVPSSLAGIVGAVVGLNSAGVMHSGATKATNPPSECVVPGVGYPCEYNPKGFARAYDATTSRQGTATNIAIFAEGNVSSVVTDLRTEERANGMALVPVSIVRTGPATADTLGLDEWDMDTQYSTGMAGSVARLTIYDASTLTDSDIASEFNRFAADDTSRAASASFGECEFQAFIDGSMLADDQAAAEAAAQGQTIFASSGDTGGFCPVGVGANGVPAGAPDVNYPASSPWVVSVGGTTLITSTNGSYSREIAWAAGGGGPSLLEMAPAWQNGIAPPSNTVCGELVDVPCGRAVPDIAMDADPNSGANVYVGGQPEGVGGTSLSSPLALGVWARLETVAKSRLGFAGPRFYRAHATAAFHDIVLGDTGPYPATPGSDFATGLGTFDIAKAISLIG
jgi:subtilase family serine protease